MRALIIAAGNGTRMQPVTHGRHKSLMPLLGLKIIERVLLGAKEAGITDFVIVTGYRSDEVKKTVGSGKKYGIRIRYIENKDWEKANGLSAYKAENLLNENFILLMSDHIFDPSILRDLLQQPLRDKQSILAIDRNFDSVRDVSDTTKVVLQNSTVKAIGKDLQKYDAYDTGIFLCTPYVFEALRKSTTKGKNSLSDGMRMLARENKLKVFDITGRLWSDCDTYDDIKFAEKKLLKSLTKSEDGFLSKSVNRKISGYITKYLVQTPITPLVITALIPFLAIIAFLLLAQGVYPWIFFGGLLVQCMSIFDGCDGEIARLKFQATKWGAWLDDFIDKYIDAAVVAGMAYGYWRVTQSESIIIITVFVMLGFLLNAHMRNKFLQISGIELQYRGPRRDIRLLTLALGAITNQVFLSFLIVLVLYQISAFGRLFAGKKMFQEIEIAKKISLSL